MFAEDWAEIRTVAKNVLIDEYGAEDGNIQPSKKNRVTLKGKQGYNLLSMYCTCNLTS